MMSKQQDSSALSVRSPENAELKSNAFIEILTTTFQNVIGYMCMDIVFAISLHFIAAHNNAQAVAGLGLATTTGKTILAPMGMAMNQSLNLHSSQALSVDSQKLSQTFFTMTVIIHIISFFLLATAIVLLGPLIALTIDKENKQATQEGAGLYIYYLLTSSLLNMIYECMKSFMSTYKVSKVFAYIQTATTILHIFWCYIFIDVLNYGGGIPGAGLAIICTEFLNCLFCLIFILCTQCKITGFKNYKFKFELKREGRMLLTYLRKSLPIIAFIYADSFAFYLRNFIALSFGSNYFNAQLALANTSSFYFRFSISLSIVLMKFINCDMSDKQKKAQSFTKVGILIYFCFAISFIVLLIILKKGWANFYTIGDEEIADILYQVFPVFLFGLIIDGLQGTLSGVLKGIEKKQFFTYTALVVNYFIGVPLVFYLSCDLYGFGVSKKVFGIWSAFAITHLTMSFLFLCSILMTNWEEVNEKILKSKCIQLLSIKEYEEEPWDMRDMIENNDIS